MTTLQSWRKPNPHKPTFSEVPGIFPAMRFNVDEYYTDGGSLTLGDTTIEFYHTPGHTLDATLSFSPFMTRGART